MQGVSISSRGQLSKIHIKIHESASASSCCSGACFFTDGSCYVLLFLLVLKAGNVALMV